MKSYAHDQVQSVEVENGKVQVTLPEDRIRLKKQEQIYLNKQSGEYSKLKRSENKVAAWRNGALHFYQTPLTDVAKELERRYHCKISFRQGEVFANNVQHGYPCRSAHSFAEINEISSFAVGGSSIQYARSSRLRPFCQMSLAARFNARETASLVRFPVRLRTSLQMKCIFGIFG